MTDLHSRVSVIIPAWNRADGLRRSIQSVLDRTLCDFELIVVDDGSDDQTPHAVDEIADKRLRLVRTAHRGVSAARNTGANEASGAVLIFLDCDDLILPGWVGELSAPILSGQCDLTISGWQMCDADGRETTWIPDSTRMTPDDIAPHFLAGAWAIATNCFQDIGGFDESITYGECTEFALRLLLSQHPPRIGSIDRPLHIHHRRIDLPPGVQATGARSVLTKHKVHRHSLPRTWAAYHTLVGVDDARNMRNWQATRHFLAALISDPRGPRRTSRFLVSLIPRLARRVWKDRAILTRAT